MIWKRPHNKKPEVVYELHPGSVYLMEYDVTQLTIEEVDNLQLILSNFEVYVLFVPRRHDRPALSPVPATPKKEQA